MGRHTALAEAGSAPTAVAQQSLGRVARGAVTNLIGAAVLAASTFGVTLAATQGLPKAQAGVFFSMTSLILLATSIGQLGTDTGLVYYLSRSRTLGDRHRVHLYFRFAMVPVMVAAVAMGVGVFLFAPELADLTAQHHQHLATGYLRAAAIFIPFAALENVSLSGTRGMGTMKFNALVEQVGRAAIQMLLVIGVVLLSATDLFVWAWAFPYAPAALVAYFAWRRLRPPVETRAERRRRPRENESTLRREFWRFAVPRAMTSVAQVAMQRFDIVLVGALSGVGNAAVYAAATRFVVAGQMANNAVGQATQPRLAETITLGDHRSTQQLYQNATAWLLLVSGPIYGLLLIFGRPLLHIFGKGYGAGSMVLILISISLVTSAACGMVDQVLAMAGHTSWNLANVALAFGVNLGLDLWLIPTHGVLGAAIGWSVAIVVKNLAALSQVAFALHLHPFGRSTGTIGAILLGCYGGVLGGSRVVLGNNVVGLLAGTVVSTVVYLVVIWLLRRPLQLELLRALRRRR